MDERFDQRLEALLDEISRPALIAFSQMSQRGV
jgi:hypothetical protein